MTDLGKMRLSLGVLLVLVGIILLVVGSVSGRAAWIGRLPGDIYIQRGKWTFYFPLATSLLLSVLLTTPDMATTRFSPSGAVPVTMTQSPDITVA